VVNTGVGLKADAKPTGRPIPTTSAVEDQKMAIATTITMQPRPVAWIKRCPNPHDDEGEIEIRQVFDFEEFAPCDPTGELRAAEVRLREQLEEKK
jgi:hypothetical protein